MVDEDLRESLLHMAALDRATRSKLVETGELFSGYSEKMERVHRQNASRLSSVLDRVGWPGLDLVGPDGTEAGWRIAQHAISSPDFQRRCHRLLSEAVAARQAPAWQLAYLTDRIRFNERRPQIYGTVFDWDERGNLSPWEIEDVTAVDERREAVGLPPLEQATTKLRAQAREEGNHPPDSFEARQREIHEWARKTGWITGDGGAA